MRIYRVVDDGTCVLTTADEVVALRKFREVMEKYDKVLDYGWIDVEEIK